MLLGLGGGGGGCFLSDFESDLESDLEGARGLASLVAFWARGGSLFFSVDLCNDSTGMPVTAGAGVSVAAFAVSFGVDTLSFAVGTAGGGSAAALGVATAADRGTSLCPPSLASPPV